MNRVEARQYFASLARDTRIAPISPKDPNRSELLADERAVRNEMLADAKTDPRFEEAQTVLLTHAEPIGIAGRYFRRLKRDLATAGDDQNLRREYIDAERDTNDYQNALQTLTQAGRPNPEPKLSLQNVSAISEPESEVVVDSPEAESKNQETIRWAYSVLDGYRGAIPEKGTKKAKIEAASTYVRGALGEILHDPDKIETAFGIWKAKSDESGFYRSAREKLPREVGRAWESISPGVLKEVVVKYSRNGFVAKEFESYLKGYFAGPKEMEGRVEACYRFTEAALDLVDDPEALRTAALIGSFDSAVTMRGDVVFQDLIIASSLGAYNREMHRKANVVTRLVMTNLERLAGFDRDEIMKKDHIALATLMKDAKFKNKYNHASRLSSTKDPKAMTEYLDTFLTGMNELTSENDGSPTEVYKKMRQKEDTDAVKKINEDTERILKEDPLARKALSKIFGRANMVVHRKYTADALQERGDDVIFVQKQVQGVMVEVGIPASIAEHKDEILTHWAADQENIDTIKSHIGAFLPVDALFDETPVFVSYRSIDESENTNRHPLEMLNIIGFPEVPSEDLRAENTALATQIIDEQRRFMNTRGFSVPLKHPALADIGYQNVTFRKNKDDVQVTDVTIRVRNTDIQVKLDKDFRFDYDGMVCDFPQSESLHNILLTVLYPALCGLSAKDHDGQETDLTKVFQTRVGYIGYLGPGRNFSDEKAREFLKVEGKDLATVSEQRKQTDPTGRERNSSYWAPVESDDPNLPPVHVGILLPEDKFTRRTRSAADTAINVESAMQAGATVVFDASSEPPLGVAADSSIAELEENGPIAIETPKKNGKAK